MPALPKQPCQTASQIADQLGVRLHQVQYLIKSRRIQSIARAGNIRLFDQAAIEVIAADVRRAADRREVRHG